MSNKAEGSMTLRAKAMNALLEERMYQEKRWGTDRDKTHTKEEWATIISVYAGKVSAETKPYSEREDAEGFLKRLMQLGAICLAAHEALLSQAPVTAVEDSADSKEPETPKSESASSEPQPE